jgi:dTDP-4-dehydrorhamnose reductase
MLKKPAFMVVGGDSHVGSSLLDSLNMRGHKTYSTTKRINTLTESRIFLDFEKIAEFNLPIDVGYVYVVAAATNYERCENDPSTFKINVELIPDFIRSLLAKGIFVNFISTNSVFGGEVPWPKENDIHNPRIAYARQKHLAEISSASYAANLRAENIFSIVRLTKVLGPDTAPIPGWIEDWNNKKVVNPFSDLIFAPISVGYVGESLAKLGEKRISGNLHLSGSINLSYVEFANAIANHLNIPKSLIDPTTSSERNITILFKPQFSGLDMKNTTKLSGIEPQELGAVIADLFNSRTI